MEAEAAATLCRAEVRTDSLEASSAMRIADIHIGRGGGFGGGSFGPPDQVFGTKLDMRVLSCANVVSRDGCFRPLMRRRDGLRIDKHQDSLL